jgi:nitrogen fixation protein NifQ
MSEEMLLARASHCVTQCHDRATLIAAAAQPDDPATLAFAGTIAMAPQRRAPYDVPVCDLDDAELAALAQRFFPGLTVPFAAANRTLPAEAHFDEFSELVTLLLDHRTCPDETSRWLAHAVATACMADNHLWQDMGLPSRGVLSSLMKTHFSSLALLNAGDMKWKKFLYRQLCERAGLRVCRAPSCGVCEDHPKCFGPEEAE